MLVTLITNSFSWTAPHSCLARPNLFDCGWLFEYVRNTSAVITTNVLRGILVTKVAIGTLASNVILARHIQWIPMSKICHIRPFVPQSNPQFRTLQSDYHPKLP